MKKLTLLFQGDSLIDSERDKSVKEHCNKRDSSSYKAELGGGEAVGREKFNEYSRRSP